MWPFKKREKVYTPMAFPLTEAEAREREAQRLRFGMGGGGSALSTRVYLGNGSWLRGPVVEVRGGGGGMTSYGASTRPYDGDLGASGGPGGASRYRNDDDADVSAEAIVGAVAEVAVDVVEALVDAASSSDSGGGSDFSGGGGDSGGGGASGDW